MERNEIKSSIEACFDVFCKCQRVIELMDLNKAEDLEHLEETSALILETVLMLDLAVNGLIIANNEAQRKYDEEITRLHTDS